MIHMKSTKGGKVIDLPRLIEGRLLLLDRLSKAKAALEKAQLELSAFDADAKAEIEKAIEQGASLGNPLQDRLISFVGVDIERMEKYLAFNDRLVAGKGEDFLIVWDQKDMSSYVLGTLSGKPMEVAYKAEEITGLFITIPFERYVHSSADHDPKQSWHHGPYQLKSSEGEGSSILLTQHLEGGKSLPIKVYFADEMEASGLALCMVAPRIDLARSLLHSEGV